MSRFPSKPTPKAFGAALPIELTAREQAKFVLQLKHCCNTRLRFWVLKSVAADTPIREMKIWAAIVCALSIRLANAADFDLAAKATNELGLDLHGKLAIGDENLCLSPYSIQSALAMTFAGADGDTRMEMARVLHFS